MVTFPFQRPLLPPPEAWRDDLASAYAARWFSNFGRLGAALEARLEARVGRPMVATASATAGLAAALLALGRPGVVLLPAFTFPATLSAVLQAGLRPRFCDADPASWELTPVTLAAALAGGEPIAAVLAVRPFGLCRDLGPLEEFCAAHGLPLIVDGAAALGGRLPDGRPAGGQGLMEVFSLHATKVFAVGEGGAIAAPSEFVGPLRTALNFGLRDGRLTGPGINGKMSEFHAAIGLAQDGAVEGHIALRQQKAAVYGRFFRDYPAWQTPMAPGDAPWQCYPVCAPDGDAATRLTALAGEVGVELRRYYRPALHAVGAFAPFAPKPLPVSADLAARMVCLPLYSDMTEAEHAEILGRLMDVMGRLPH